MLYEGKEEQIFLHSSPDVDLLSQMPARKQWLILSVICFLTIRCDS